MNWKNVLIFGAGLAIGAIAGVQASKKYYEELRQQDIDEMKEAFGLTQVPYNENDEGEPDVDPSVVVYNQRVKEYSTGAGTDRPDIQKKPSLAELAAQDRELAKKIEEDEANEPFIISVDEFVGELEHWGKETLYWWGADNILSDVDDEIVYDQVDILGQEAVRQLREEDVEDDPIYVRNPRREVDYEVEMSAYAFSERDGVYEDGDK